MVILGIASLCRNGIGGGGRILQTNGVDVGVRNQLIDVLQAATGWTGDCDVLKLGGVWRE